MDSHMKSIATTADVFNKPTHRQERVIGEHTNQPNHLHTRHEAGAQSLEVSIVMPCLNEAETIGICVQKAFDVLKKYNINGEVVVSDNGSTDGSIEIATREGARVVHQPLRGYGNAYMMGFECAQAPFILMADSDNTYDFYALPQFLELLHSGYDMVMGNRFSGKILPGAMPWHHRYIGNPVLSGILNLFFHTGIGDAHCGMRAFTREAYQKMGLQTGGMEFASEMVINAAKTNLKIADVPITYYPRQGESKLHSFRDGWRHLRFMLLYSPTHLFLWPGGFLMFVGMLALFFLAFGPLQIGQMVFGFHWMFVASLLAIHGFQIICLGFFARVYSLSIDIDRTQDRLVSFFSNVFRMEHGILIGNLLAGLGIGGYILVLVSWLGKTMTQPQSIRLGILALTLIVIGAQMVFSSFFISMMVIKRRGWQENKRQSMTSDRNGSELEQHI